MKYIYDPLVGLWTKCLKISADRFLKNWKESKKSQAFLLYDKQPFLPPEGIVFIHSDKKLHSWARFIRSERVKGYKQLPTRTRMKEREKVWNKWRANQLYKPTKHAFDKFWENQNGVRSLFVMKKIKEVKEKVLWGEYSKVLEMGFPKGVGYRYLSRSEVEKLFRLMKLEIPSLPNI